MSDVRINQWRKESYGVTATGSVDGQRRRIPIQLFSPHDDVFSDTVPKIVNFNGIVVGQETMRTPARVAAELGYAAITLDYTNTDDRGTPIASDAQDGLDVLEAFDADEYRLLGLSMGGAVATHVAANTHRTITNLDLVAPGGFTDELLGVGPLTVAEALRMETIDEMLYALRNPFSAVSIAIGSLANCSHRTSAVMAEANQMTHTTSFPELVSVRRNSPDTVVTLAHGSHDRLIPRKPLLRSMAQHAITEGIPMYDLSVPYRGGHSEIVYNPRVARRVLLASSGIDPQYL